MRGAQKCTLADRKIPEAASKRTPTGIEERRRPSIRPGRTCAGDWSCSGFKQIGGTRPAPAYHHSVHAGELAHPAQPDNLE